MDNKENIANIAKKATSFYSFGRYQSSQLDFQEVIGKKDYIEFGKKNDFPQELIRLYQTSSPLHKSLLDKKAQMTAGNGFDETLLGTSLLDKAFLEIEVRILKQLPRKWHSTYQYSMEHS